MTGSIIISGATEMEVLKRIIILMQKSDNFIVNFSRERDLLKGSLWYTVETQSREN